MHFKNLEGKLERESPKRTVFASGGLGLLQMVLEPDTRQCASKDVEPRRGWTGESHIDWRREQVSARTLGLEGGWIVRSHVSWGGKRSILYKGMETSPMQTRFKNLEGNLKRKGPKITISTYGGLIKRSEFQSRVL